MLRRRIFAMLWSGDYHKIGTAKMPCELSAGARLCRLLGSVGEGFFCRAAAAAATEEQQLCCGALCHASSAEQGWAAGKPVNRQRRRSHLGSTPGVAHSMSGIRLQGAAQLTDTWQIQCMLFVTLQAYITPTIHHTDRLTSGIRRNSVPCNSCRSTRQFRPCRTPRMWSCPPGTAQLPGTFSLWTTALALQHQVCRHAAVRMRRLATSTAAMSQDRLGCHLIVSRMGSMLVSSSGSLSTCVDCAHHSGITGGVGSSFQWRRRRRRRHVCRHSGRFGIEQRAGPVERLQQRARQCSPAEVSSCTNGSPLFLLGCCRVMPAQAAQMPGAALQSRIDARSNFATLSS